MYVPEAERDNVLPRQNLLHITGVIVESLVFVLILYNIIQN